MGELLTILMYFGSFYIGIQILVAVFGLAGGLIELSLTILYGIVYGLVLLVRYLVRITTGKEIMGSFNRRVNRRSGKLGGLTIDRPNSFHRSTQVSYRSTERDQASKNRPSNLSPNSWKTVWDKQHKGGGTSTIQIKVWVLNIWEKFIDLFREREK